jgi:phage shock protein A
MFKVLLTLMRSRVETAGEELADRNALMILDHQIRDASVAFERAKKASAVGLRRGP